VRLRDHLVITADDFGLAGEVNEAVESGHRHGMLSAASLMVAGQAAGDAVERARRLPQLRVGLHIVVVDGKPALAPDRIPDLVDGRGLLRSDFGRLAWDIALRPGVRKQLAAEITSQFEAYKATGLALDHVDAHNHFHLHPLVAGAIIAIGRRYGMRALRVPAEPASTIKALEPDVRPPSSLGLTPWQTLLRARARAARLIVPDAVFGLAWSGAMTPDRLARILGRLPPGLVEIYLHPATSNNFAGSAPGYRYTEEFAALTDARCLRALRQSGRRPGGFGDYPGPP
jgi:chitin disaccharide deacetylase